MATKLMVLYSSRSLKKISLEVNWQSFRCLTNPQGRESGKEGGRTRVTYFGRKRSFLRPRHVRKFVKEGYFFVPRYKVKGGGGGGKNTHTIHEIYAALTPSDSQSDLASEFAAANCCRLTSSDINVNPTYFPVSVFILLLRR